MIEMNRKSVSFSPNIEPETVLQVSNWFYLTVFVIFLCPISFIYVGLGISEFIKLKAFTQEASDEILNLKDRISQQDDDLTQQQNKIKEYLHTISAQHGRITKYDNEIESFQNKLQDLLNFEQQIRSNLNDLASPTGLTGIGGENTDESGMQKYRNDMIAQLKMLNQTITTRKKGFESILQYLKEQRQLLLTTPTLCPTKGYKTSGFGFRLSPFTGFREFHNGIDIATKPGTYIRASGDGEIVFNGELGALGNAMDIDHGNGIFTRYGHIDRFFKKQGDRVKKGEVIACVGNTGRSTGPHLHYEIRLNGDPVNPELYISKSEKRFKLK